MSDESKLSEAVVSGDEARTVLDSPAFQRAYDKVRTTILDGWARTPADGAEERHNAYLMIRLLEELKQHLNVAAQGGEIARKELLRIRDPENRSDPP